MQINKQILIIPLALAGLYILNLGMRALHVSGFSNFAFAAVVIGIGISLCALILTFREDGSSIKFFRIVITAMIGAGIMLMGMTGLLTDAKGMLLTLYYSIVFVSIIILCIALFLAYREYGHYDIKLRE